MFESGGKCPMSWMLKEKWRNLEVYLTWVWDIQDSENMWHITLDQLGLKIHLIFTLLSICFN